MFTSLRHGRRYLDSPSIFLAAFGGVFFAQLSDGSLGARALKIGRKETFVKDCSTFKDT